MPTSLGGGLERLDPAPKRYHEVYERESVQIEYRHGAFAYSIALAGENALLERGVELAVPQVHCPLCGKKVEKGGAS